MKNLVAEFGFGEGSVKVIAKIVVLPAASLDNSNLDRTLIAGVAIGRLNEELPTKDHTEILDKSLEYEMWEGEIIFIPRRKYRGRKPGHSSFAGLRIDQVLVNNWSNPEGWLEKIFEKEPE